FAFLERRAKAGAQPWPLLLCLLAAADPALLSRGLDAAEAACREGGLCLGEAEADELAGLAERPGSGLREPAALRRLRILLAGLDLRALCVRGRPARLRRFAASLLDSDGTPADPSEARAVLGPGPAEALRPYLEFTRASRLDLVCLRPEPDGPVPVAESLPAAEALLARPLLMEVFSRLGWSRVAWGLSVEPLVGVSLGGLPLAVRPAEAPLLEACGPSRRAWERSLITAHGEDHLAGTAGSQARETVRRFRSYNIAHAELLTELLKICPLTPSRAARITGLLDGIVEDFVALFSGLHDETAALPEAYRKLKEASLVGTAGAGADEPLAADPTRRILMFEDPKTLAETRTLHGLKRYLHQQGLALAFKLFHSGGVANRTVDLMTASRSNILLAAQRLRYIDFEPEEDRPASDLPPAVRMAAEAFGRHLLHGHDALPQLELLCYGNEVQAYALFRNHPAFLRLDLSPPLRGGMVDLQYYGVSQYDLGHHPAPELPAIKRLFARLDFLVEADGFRLKIRYDKERAVGLGDVADRAGAVFRALPFLMELDWKAGSLEYPETALAAVAEAWTDFITRWGVLPLEEILTKDRRRVLAAIQAAPGGEKEVPWDGRGAYRDLLSGSLPDSFWERLREALQAAGLQGLPRWDEQGEHNAGQLLLERSVLIPLRQACARGEIVAGPGGYVPADAGTFVSQHESGWFGRVLVDRGDTLSEAVRMAGVVSAIERHLRFKTSGSVQGYPVQRALLPLRDGSVGVYVLRDEKGAPRLGAAANDGVIFNRASVPGRDGTAGSLYDCATLVRLLCRDNYVSEDLEDALRVPAEDPEKTADAFLGPNPFAAPRPLPGERVIPATAASPGRVSGFARFGTSDLRPEECERAILVSPTLGPKDAAALRRVAGIVTTGGAVLSHAGLLALEMHKPSVIVAGRWRRDPEGGVSLVCRRAEYVEEAEQHGPYRVCRYRDLHEREETVREGDLLVVDADAGVLLVIGQDRDALALNQEFSWMEAAAERLARVQEEPDVLATRGQFLRAAHQLEKLLARADRPDLARHAAREILHARQCAQVPEGRAARLRLLELLCSNRAVGESAREAAVQWLGQTSERHRAAVREALASMPDAVSLHEPLYLRLAVLRIREALRDLSVLLPGVGSAAEGPDIDAAAVESLKALRERLLLDVPDVLDRGGAPEVLHHIEVQLGRIETLLGPGLGEFFERLAVRTASWKSEVLRKASERLVLGPGDGGLELAPLIGHKAANLGEMGRIIPGETVPRWFAVADAALTATLGRPVPGAEGTLEEEIAKVLSRSDLDCGRQAAEVRRLWREVSIPEPVQRDILDACRGLTAGLEPDECFLAVRSSGLEEDSESSSWAGQFDTFLFVRGEASLLEHLRLAWAGFWNERALRGRSEDSGRPAVPHGKTLAGGSAGGARVGGGVVVQRMVRSRVSGVLHTVCAAPGRSGEMLVNAGLGLGEGIVSGSVEADHVFVSRRRNADGLLHFRYQVADKKERVVFDALKGTGTRMAETLYHQRLRPALEYVELLELSAAAEKLERAYGQPLDIEFAWEGHHLRLLQARPIPPFCFALRETLAHYPLKERTP
ncbi:MAG: PEP/pyruvate-binding domain-containing protein, partial [Elusimicrobiota bacterium]